MVGGLSFLKNTQKYVISVVCMYDVAHEANK